ncbi:MAG: hypothetical protein K6G56_07720 [Clostridiales bacterium]|nr:hypothetical protein [Clostridiales bacterium]
MTDIHSHILPGVDDGSQSLEESLEMLFMAAESGVETIVATPHCNIPGEYENYVSPEIDGLFMYLKEEARRRGAPIKLLYGMEIFATEDLPELLEKGRARTLNGTKYFLTEFSFGEDPYFCADVLRRCRDKGFIPVIAHPERYVFVQDDPQTAFEWCVSGCALQVNKGSLLGRFGYRAQRTAELLIDHGLAACVASDAHGSVSRTTHMGEIREHLTENLGHEYARLLLRENPSRILAGKELLGYEPIPFI